MFENVRKHCLLLKPVLGAVAYCHANVFTPVECPEDYRPQQSQDRAQVADDWKALSEVSREHEFSQYACMGYKYVNS